MKNSIALSSIRKIIFFGFLLVTAKTCFAAAPPLKGISIFPGQNATAPGPLGCPQAEGGDVGVFYIGVSPPFTNDIVVGIARTGSAVGPAYAPQDECANGSLHLDYHVSYPLPDACASNSAPEQIVIPAGTGGVTVSIIPLLNLDCKTNETVTMTISASAPGYVLGPNQATIQLFATDTLGTEGLFATPNLVMEGESTMIGCGRACSCATPRPLSSVPVTSTFYLAGSAVYGVDYTINPVPGITVDTITVPPTVVVYLGVSNDFINCSLTTYSNCEYGDKVVAFVPFCSYFPNACYYGPPKWVTNQDCVYEVGTANSLLTISHPTIQPTLDTAAYSAPVFQFNINGQTGAPYAISTSTNLLDWTDVGSVVMTSCTMQASDLLAGNFPQRFYRVRIAGAGTIINNGSLTFQEATPSPQVETFASSSKLSATRLKNTASESVDTAAPLSSEEQMLLIEINRKQLEDEGNPEALLIPPTPLTPVFKGSSHE